MDTLCEVLYWFCLYQVQTLPASKKGQHLKDFAWFCEFSDFMTEDPPPYFPPGFFINIETCTRNFEIDIIYMLVTKHLVNT